MQFIYLEDMETNTLTMRAPDQVVQVQALGTLYCVLVQDTLLWLTVPLATLMYKWVPANF